MSVSHEDDPSGGLEWLNNSYDRFLLDDRDRQVWNLFRTDITNERLHVGHHSFAKTVILSSYWDRAWVRQEYARSKHSIIMPAFEFCESDYFYKALRQYSKPLKYRPGRNIAEWLWDFPSMPRKNCPMDPSSDSCQACKAFGNMFIHYERFQNARRLKTKALGSASLIEHLQYAKDTMASDDRDMVFAFLGISSTTYGIVADYSRHIALGDVLCQLASCLIVNDGHLGLLRVAYATMRFILSGRCPSWVPDWLVKSSAEFRMYRSAALQESPRSQSVATFLPDESGRQNRVLQVRGGLYSQLKSDANADDWRYIGFGYRASGKSQIWWIDGIKNWCVLRELDGGDYEWACFAVRLPHNNNELGNIQPDHECARFDEMVESGHSAIRTIKIY